ncbi:MAG: NADH-quinone oxidoreductase subunit L [Chloroflexi bacterium]|nr:NADH-quinone oxidoreductase subunit L [Chloroflexota bacterium]
MESIGYLWLIPLFPLLSFLIIVFLTRGLPKLSSIVCILSMFLSFLVAVWALSSVIAALTGGHALAESLHRELTVTWFSVGNLTIPLGLILDPLTAMMLFSVTGVSLLIQIYSTGYMAGDPGYSRYFAFMSLFTMSMLGLVLANNFVQLYITWELVGLCSYLLIGFWFQKPEAAAAAKKAFITTRLGDLGLLVGILILYFSTHSFVFTDIESGIKAGAIGGGLLTVAAVLVFCGAIGKSAQFPLHVWLPDAMEGPTPVSALIHAATMVAAGVYLVARAANIFAAAPDSLVVVAYVGGFTALFAASMGLVMNDIKKVMAYSTISQLGYMMMALGLGGGVIVAGVFHLFTHTFFKALLFLGSGSVIHSAGEQDMRKLGGLGKPMKITMVTMIIASLALAGFPGFSGFWSKDEILAAAFQKNMLLFGMGLLGAFFTAFYIFRAMFMTFFGEHRGQAASEHASDHSGHGSHGGHGLHESPLVMTIPLMILAIPSLLLGFLGSPLTGNLFATFITAGEHEAEGINLLLMGISSVVAIAGIFFAWLVYGIKVIPAEAIGRAFSPIHTLLSNKYYMDELYLGIIDKVVLGVSRLWLWFDLHVVDGAVNGVASLVGDSGTGLRRLETGRVPNYGLAIFVGTIIIAGLLALNGRMP